MDALAGEALGTALCRLITAGRERRARAALTQSLTQSYTALT